MRARQGAPAQFRVIQQVVTLQQFGQPAETARLQLTQVEFSLRSRVAHRAEKNVGRRLHHALASDDALALSAGPDAKAKALQHGLLRFFHLDEQGSSSGLINSAIVQ